MPQHNAKRSSRRGRRKTQGSPQSTNPPVTSLVYRGPFRPSANIQPPPVSMTLTYVVPFGANGTGICQKLVGADPTQSAEWSTMLNLFAEARILSMKLDYVPSQHYFPATTGGDPGLNVWYSTHNMAYTVPSSLDTALQYSDSSPKPGDMPHNRVVRMSGTNESTFYNVSSFSPTFPLHFGVGLYGTQYTPSASIGQAFVTLLVQFRNRA